MARIIGVTNVETEEPRQPTANMPVRKKLHKLPLVSTQSPVFLDPITAVSLAIIKVRIPAQLAPLQRQSLPPAILVVQALKLHLLDVIFRPLEAQRTWNWV